MLTLCALAILLLPLVSRYYRARFWKSTLPPGPNALPFIGNILDLNVPEVWRKVNRWGHQFGDFVCLHVFGTPFLFIETGEAALELLNKRNAIYSDRPILTMAGDMCGMDELVPLTRTGERQNLERRLMNKALGPSVVKQWRPEVVREVRTLLNRLLCHPDAFVSHFKRMAGALVFSAVYGYHVQTDHDPLVKGAEDMMQVTSAAMIAGWAVDFFPLLKHVPGVPCRRLAVQWKALMLNWVNSSHDIFKNLPDSEEKRRSFCGRLLLSDDDQDIATPELEHRVKWMAASMYGPGLDTTMVVLSQFTMALVFNPEVQEKAQDELDRIVGRHRLPEFADRPHLPYVDCILKETIRWGTPVPLTPPHRLTQPDSYKVYDFPEGSLFNANMWSMLHDERVYPDPERFYPERFTDGKVLANRQHESLPPDDPYLYAFGFGRRKCPGLHFADQSLWLAMASILACFHIRPFIDDTGKEVPPELVFDGGVFRDPKPFKCRITSRHEGVSALIRMKNEQ